MYTALKHIYGGRDLKRIMKNGTSSFYVSFNVVTVDIQETQNGGTWGDTSDLGNDPDSSLGWCPSLLHPKSFISHTGGCAHPQYLTKGRRGGAAPDPKLPILQQFIFKTPLKPPVVAEPFGGGVRQHSPRARTVWA